MLRRARPRGTRGLQTLAQPTQLSSPIEHDLFSIFSDANQITEQSTELQLDLEIHKKNQLASLKGQSRDGRTRGQPSQLGLAEISRSRFTRWKSRQPKILKGQTTLYPQRNQPAATRCW
jgi:hypothetical protein